VTNARCSALFRVVAGLIAGVVLGLGGLAPLGSAQAEPVKAAHLTAELIADHASITPGGHIHLAIRQVMEPGWHTYWRNPGDSGEPTTVKWTLPPGWNAGDLQWPTPKLLPIPPLVDYGYEGVVLLAVDLTAPASAKPGDSVTLTAQASFLVCQETCVPADATLTITLPVTAEPGAADPRWSGAISRTLDALPRPGPLRATVTPSATGLRLSVTGEPLKGVDFPAAYFYPYDGGLVDAAKPQPIDRGADGLSLALTLSPNSKFKSPTPPTTITGVLSLGDKAYEVTAPVGPPLPGAGGLGPPDKPLPPAQQLKNLAGALLSAVLGGLILNLMPCVFPVLSMKAASLARHAHEPAAARIQGLAFMAGVILTFLVLAGVLIAARAAGESIGWGFQLQSPVVLGGFALVMLLVGLNLSGLFEVGAGVQSLAGGVEVGHPDSTLGAFFTGALAVAVAAPCTAPFMAPAIGYALTQGPVVALSIFAALGLGLGLPFTALAFAPGLLSKLPRPGAWMDVLRRVLAFPMYATAAWLAWVFSQQVGDQLAGNLGLAGILAAAVLTAAAAWLYGLGQSAGIAGRRAWPLIGLAAVALAVGLGAVVLASEQPAPPARGAGAVVSKDELPSEPFSPARLAALRAAGKPVFVNFTAAWCITCQVNDRVALSSKRMTAAFAAKGVTYLVGDWTNRNADIAAALAAQGRAGVPLYLVYPAGGGEPAVLPQILTEDVVLAALDKAAR
jgi:thiol:disulfide interchange protein/DsbC/DsbD-like thiol-disulfide interchange protein